MKKTILTVIAAAAIVSLTFFSCKKENSETVASTQVSDVQPVLNQKDVANISYGDSLLIEQFSQKVVVAFQEISSLEQVNYCALYSILNNSGLSANDKLVQIDANPNLDNVHSALIDISAFVNSNSAFAQNLHNNDTPTITLFSNRLLWNLGFDVNAPIANCNAYNSQINSCAVGFGVCVGAAILGGGPACGVIIGLCGIDLMYCVDAADAASPGCAQGGAAITTIKNKWLVIENTSCNPPVE